MKKPHLTGLFATLILVCSGIISWLIANVGVDTGNMEMAAIAPLFFPPLIALVSIILFLLIDWASPKKRFWVTICLAVFNLLCGLFIRLEMI